MGRAGAQQTEADEPSSGTGDEIAEHPQLAPGVVLAGEMKDGAYQEQQWLVQRDGQFIQITELLYRIAEQVDGRRDLEQIAEAASATINRRVSEDNVRQLLSAKLIPLGLVAKADGSVVEQDGADGGGAARSPLQINMRVRALSPRFIDPLTAVLQYLFWPPVLLAVLTVAAAAQVYVFVIHGVASSMHEVLYQPALMFAVLGMVIVGTIWHEFGHASALRYGGGQVRGMGAGIYLVYPAFYTDVTDNYRLPRWSKVRTDLGGFYFNLIFGAAMVGLYFLTQLPWLLLIVLLIDLEILQQTLPFGRYDGYWTLADITGIPDFFSRIPSFVKSMLPFVKSEDTEFSRYKGWVRVVFALYILVTTPIMAFIFFTMIKGAPRILATGWDSAHKQLNTVQTAHAHGDIIGIVLAVAQLLILALPTLGLIYILGNLARRGGKALWNYSKPTPARRIKGSLIALAIVGFLGYLWAPQIPFGGGRSGPLYSSASWIPIRANERGTLGDAGNSLAQVPVKYNPFQPAPPPAVSPAGGAVTATPIAQPTARAQATAKAHATATAQAKATAKATTTPAATPTPLPAAGIAPTETPVATVDTTPTQQAVAPQDTITPLPTAPATLIPTLPPTLAP